MEGEWMDGQGEKVEGCFCFPFLFFILITFPLFLNGDGDGGRESTNNNGTHTHPPRGDETLKAEATGADQDLASEYLVSTCSLVQQQQQILFTYSNKCYATDKIDNRVVV